MKKPQPKKRSVKKQFEEIWRKLNDPIEIAKQRIINNRKERITSKKDDLAI